MNNAVELTGKIKRETEKAVLVQIPFEHMDTMEMLSFDAWMPKSQIKISEEIIITPQWLADKIGNQIREAFHFCKNQGGKYLIYD